MSWLIAIFLGIIQGIAEFLPISSSGHLILVSKIFGIQNDIMPVSILLHFATLVAVIFVFRKYIWEMIKHPFSKDAVSVYIATIPTVLIVFLIKGAFNNFFNNFKLLPYGFMITGLVLLLTYLIAGKKKEDNIKGRPIKYESAILMGIVQGLAIFPGVSRSGSTICTGILSEEKRESATRFSFIMSIPIIVASVAYEFIFGEYISISVNMITPLVFAFIAALIVGLFSIRLMLKIMQKAKYYWFSIYLFVLSIISFFII